jgi:hypothetical protein
MAYCVDAITTFCHKNVLAMQVTKKISVEEFCGRICGKLVALAWKLQFLPGRKPGGWLTEQTGRMGDTLMAGSR